MSSNESIQGWIQRLEGMGLVIGTRAKEILLAKGTKGPKKYSIQISNHREVGAEPGVEVGLLLRELFTDAEIQQMGFKHLVVMHNVTRAATRKNKYRLGVTTNPTGSLCAYRCNNNGARAQGVNEEYVGYVSLVVRQPVQDGDLTPI